MIWNPATTGSAYGTTNKELAKRRRFLLRRAECKTALAASHDVLEASSYKLTTLELDLWLGGRDQAMSLRERLTVHFEGDECAV